MAGKELLIPTLILLFGAHIKLAGRLSLAVVAVGGQLGLVALFGRPEGDIT